VRSLTRAQPGHRDCDRKLGERVPAEANSPFVAAMEDVLDAPFPNFMRRCRRGEFPSMQTELPADRFEFRRLDQARMRNGDGMQ
jgi:hypothetical protein